MMVDLLGGLLAVIVVLMVLGLFLTPRDLSHSECKEIQFLEQCLVKRNREIESLRNGLRLVRDNWLCNGQVDIERHIDPLLEEGE